MEYSNKWQKRSITDILGAFDVNPITGLSEKKVSQNRRIHGKNLLWDPGSPFMFLRRSGGMSLFGYGLMIVASVCAYVFGVTNDLFAIIVSALFGVSVMFVMYVTSGLVCVKHAKKWIPVCTVIRNGKEKRISADELVPGDIVTLSEGDICPADVKIIASSELYVNERFSSGRQGSISKMNTEGALIQSDTPPVEDFIYAASQIISGECTCVVCLTGKRTLVFSRRGAFCISSRFDPPSLKKVRRSSSGMATAMLVFSFFTVVAGLVCPLSNYSLVELVLICLALSVSVTDDLLPAAGYLMYTATMSELSGFGLLLRDVSGAEYIASSEGIVVESSTYMKVGKTRIVSAYSGGTLTDNCEKTGDLLSLIYTGTSNGSCKYGDEVIRGIHNYSEKTGKSFEEFIKQARSHRAVIDSLASKDVNYTIFADGTGILFSVVGSIESVLAMCTRLQTETGDVPLDRKNLSSLLESAAKASEEASHLIGVAVRKSPYNSMKRLSVLTSDLTFLGFVALDSLADETLSEELTDLRSLGKKLILLTDGIGEDVNFARRMGIIGSREDIATTDDDREKVFTEGVGGAVLCESSEDTENVLKLARKQNAHLIFLGGKITSDVGGFTVICNDKPGKSAAIVTDKERGAIIPLLKGIRIGVVMEKRFSTLKLCLTVSAFLRGIYALTAVFGSVYVYSAVLLLWSALIDGAISVTILLRSLKRKD